MSIHWKVPVDPMAWAPSRSEDELTRRITDGVPGKFAEAPGKQEQEQIEGKYPAYLKLAAPSALDTQEGGDHYKDMKIQPVEFITANDLDFLQGNVVKYIARHKAKNGAQDVRKALHYCQMILELQYGEKP